MQSFLHDALEASFDCVKIVGCDGRLIYMNVNGCSLMEVCSPSEVLGQIWASFWPEAERPAVEQALARTLRGEPQRFEAPCATARGALKHWDVVLAPLRDAAGAVQGALVTSRDVTEWRRAKEEALLREREIRAQAAALRSAGEVAKIGGWEIDCLTRRVHWADETWALLRAEPRPIDLDEAMNIYAPRDRERMRACFETAQVEHRSFTIQVRLTRFDGTPAVVRVFGEPVVENGVCVRIRGAAQDISELAEADRGRLRAERRLELAAELAHLHVFEIDYQLGVLAKHGAEDTFFEAPQTFESLSGGLHDVVHPADRPRVQQESVEALRRCEPLRTTFRMARNDGREVWARCVLVGKLDGTGRLQRVVGALQNVTEAVLAHQELVAAKERAEAANAAKSAFLANISHEIRTPLNGVVGMAQVMRMHELSADQAERLEVITSSGDTLMAMLNDVLDLSKIEAGRLELEAHPFDLEEAVGAACAVFSATAAAKDLSLIVEVCSNVRGLWVGDAVRLRQVLSNLVSNAVKFTQAGSVVVSVRQAPGGVAFSVKDTGIGFSHADQAAIFAPFTQADVSITRRYGGAGLGLAICRRLVALMGGELTARSEVGAGADFTFVLPLDRAGAAPFTADAGEGAALLPRRVLVAEDNPVNQLVLRSMLEPLGVGLRVVGDGGEAVAAAQADDFDLILMDIQMPGMNGVDATRAIRAAERASGRPRTPIIALSANVMAHQIDDYMSAGMDGHVAKPISVELLIRKMAELAG